MNPDMLLGRMRDIRGLDPVGLWPLAPGWWLLLAALLALALAAVYGGRLVRAWRQSRPQRWRGEAIRQLAALEQQIGRESPKSLSVSLSELLRRIAVAQCGREACAGLEGERWLAWLGDNDPRGFLWRKHRRVLLELPYAPPALADSAETGAELRELIAAARAWVRHGQKNTGLIAGGADGI